MGRRERDVRDGIHIHYQLDSSTVSLRIPAVFVLLLQFQQLALPALCMPMDRPATGCHDSQTHRSGPIVTSIQTPASCAQASMCSAPATGIPAIASPGVASAGAQRVDVAELAAHVPSDPVAPPAPPPQA